MKASIHLHIIWAAAAVCAFAAGIFLGNDPTKGEARTTRITSAPLPEALVSSSAQVLLDVPPAVGHTEALSAEAIRVRAFHVAADPLGRVARMRQLCDLLSQVTPENWRDVLDGFERAPRTKNGGVNDSRDILIEHIGAIAGGDALNDALRRDDGPDTNRVHTLLRGWLENDPKAGVAWWQAQSEEIQKAYRGNFLTGLSRSDPKTALEFTLKSNEGFYKGGTTKNIVDNGVNLLGVKGVEEIFVSMRNRSDIPTGAKNEFFASLAKKTLTELENASNPADEILGWYQNHVGHPYVSPRETSRILGRAAKTNPKATISWLETHGERLPVNDAAAGFSTAAKELQQQSPQEFSVWLTAHPAHPQRDGMIEAATDALIEIGDLDGALRMSGGIGSLENRTRVTEAVKRSAASQTEPAR